MFLINAIYFKASWRDRFDASETHSAPFHSVRGDEHAQLMHRKHDMSYAETPTFQAVDLPYGDSAFTMTVLLPKSPADVESVAASLTPAAWQSLTSSFASRDVDLSLPKLSLEWKHDLIPDLQALGMQTPFVPGGADFTRMSPLGAQLYISLVRQKTYVSVDEEGTEAAAVTGVGVTVTAVEVPAVMRVDRPYLFVIRERLTGTVLFMGKIVAMPQS
jgi:serpin B